MKTFDFGQTEQWVFSGAVLSYEVSDEAWLSYGMEICTDIMHFNNSRKEAEKIYSREQIIEKLNPESRYASRCTCDHCGAAFTYGAMFQNAETKEYAVVGHICAVNTLNLTASEFANKKMRAITKRARSLAENKRVREINQTKLDEMQTTDIDTCNALNFDHYVCKDIKKYFLNYGKLSEAQKNLALKIHKEEKEKAEKESNKVIYNGFIGEIKKRQDFKVEVVFVTGFERDGFSYYSPTEWVHVIGMKTEEGKLILSKTPSFGAGLEVGQILTIKATVKEHVNYKGSDQTIIQRVKKLVA